MTNPYGDLQPGPAPSEGQYTQQPPAQPQYAQQPHHGHYAQSYPVQQQAPYHPPGQPHPYGQPPPAGFPAAYPGPPAPPPRPITIWIASVVVWLLTGAGVIGGILLMAMQDSFTTALESIEDLDGFLQAGLSAFLTFVGATLLASCAVLLLFSVFAFRGANWARWVVVVWLGSAVIGSMIHLLQLLLRLQEGPRDYSWLLELPVIFDFLPWFAGVGVVLYSGLVVLYLVPISHRWYRQHPRSRR